MGGFVPDNKKSNTQDSNLAPTVVLAYVLYLIISLYYVSIITVCKREIINMGSFSMFTISLSIDLYLCKFEI